MATSEIPHVRQTHPKGIDNTHALPDITLRADTQKQSLLFMELDREKLQYAKQIFDMGHKSTLEIERQPILPKRLVDKMLEAATPEERKTVLRINEMLLDTRIVGNIGDELDQTVKKAVMWHPGLRNGLAILNGHNYAFMEHDKYGGSARDLKKALKKVSEFTGSKSNFGSFMTPYLPIPFEGSKLDYGTWGRPAVINQEVDASKVRLDLSLLGIHTVKRFLVDDKKEKGFWPTDVTNNVQKIVSDSKLDSGFAVVTTLHTTIGIMKMDPKDMKQMHKDLLSIAPDDQSLYYHNKIATKGELKLREDGDTLGDGNGQSHVMASLIGSYTIVPVKNGRLVLENNDRILHLDCDTLPPRERGVAVTLIEKPKD
jgi:thiamine phosphate synthase YjbQ (UPF0047 family)